MKRISMLMEGPCATYASYILSSESAEQLVEWMNNVGIKEQIKSEELHITTTFSTKDVDIVPADRPINLNHLYFKIGVLGDALVLLVKSNELTKVHNNAISSGATYDYESYTPHISLSYKAEANKDIIKELIPPSFDIKLTHEEVKKTTEEMTGVGAVATTTLPITKKVVRRSKTLKDLIKEGFGMGGYYGIWGWIEPNGKLLLPTQEQRLNPRSMISHRELFKSKYGDTKEAVRLGYVRFAVDSMDRILELDFDGRSPEIRTTITNGMQNIDSLLNDDTKLRKIYGDMKDGYGYLTISYTDRGSNHAGGGLRQLYNHLSSLDVIKSSSAHNESKTTLVSNEDYARIKNKKKTGASWKSIIEEFDIDFHGPGPLRVQNNKGEFTFIKYGNYRF